MTDLDAALTTWINGWSGHIAAADVLMTWISALGIPVLVLAVAVQWWLPRPDRSSRHILVAAGLSFLLGLGFNQIVLLFVHRLRPYDVGVSRLLVERSADFSVPSDHATASVAIATAFLLHGFKRQGLVLLAVAVLLAVSRVYIGTHFLSDVLGGAITGVAAAAAVRAAYREGTRADRLITGIL
ncbi:phosphatase PAP2 family protein [Alsobacter sp. KACC 23698]|uniref:Phosphatase PAP2 family protein n=1 Tax=Alsobacter sp. KACC 23698 TaxID=3149229 RepID=A0AAU7JE93_9HYPH